MWELYVKVKVDQTLVQKPLNRPKSYQSIVTTPVVFSKHLGNGFLMVNGYSSPASFCSLCMCHVDPVFSTDATQQKVFCTQLNLTSKVSHNI